MVNLGIGVNIVKIRVGFKFDFLFDEIIKVLMIDRTSLRSYQPKYKKTKIPKALREQLWIHKVGRVFECPCKIRWCDNVMTAFDYHIGHNIPESRGGTLHWYNLIPICCRCNLSMGSQFTIYDFNRIVSG